MSVESILAHILSKADAQAKEIIAQAQHEAKDLIAQAKKQAETNYQEIFQQERRIGLKDKERSIVNARLKYKNDLLKAKHEVMDEVFKRLSGHLKSEVLKKQQVSLHKTQDVAASPVLYLQDMRLTYEAQIAKILFL